MKIGERAHNLCGFQEKVRLCARGRNRGVTMAARDGQAAEGQWPVVATCCQARTENERRRGCVYTQPRRIQGKVRLCARLGDRGVTMAANEGHSADGHASSVAERLAA